MPSLLLCAVGHTHQTRCHTDGDSGEPGGVVGGQLPQAGCLFYSPSILSPSQEPSSAVVSGGPTGDKTLSWRDRQDSDEHVLQFTDPNVSSIGMCLTSGCSVLDVFIFLSSGKDTKVSLKR